jgi:hypothetical protein
MCDAGSTGEWASIAWMPLLLVDPTFGRALNITPNPHGGAAAPGAAASSLICLQHRRDSAPAAVRLLASDRARFRSSSSLKGIGVALFRVLGAGSCSDPSRRRSFESGIRLAPVIIARETVLAQGDSFGGRAGCPTATQPEPITVSPSFIRLPAGNWQAALWSCTEKGGPGAKLGRTWNQLGTDLALPRDALVLVFKFRLTTRPYWIKADFRGGWG